MLAILDSCFITLVGLYLHVLSTSVKDSNGFSLQEYILCNVIKFNNEIMCLISS
jgi:hypothetical protein